MTAPAAFDLDAYCARIGYSGPRTPTLETLHALTLCQATAIPFENLDVLLSRPVGLSAEALMAKLVHARRGGYCFEQNGLMQLALEACGFRVTPIGARVRWQMPRDIVPPRTHLFLRVHLPGGDWFTDIGLGSGSLTGAIPFTLDRELPTPHEPRRLLAVDDRYLHQVWLGDAWADLCEFTFFDMHPIDREIANWWTSTNPNSKFKQDLMAAIALPDGTRKAIRGGVFTHRHGATILTEQPINDSAQMLAVLARHFGLHFPPATRFGPPGAGWMR